MKRAFYILSQSWYANVCLPSTDGYVDEVMFGLYDGTCTKGEMAMRWYRLGGTLTPRLEIFDDAWGVIPMDVITALAEYDNRAITPEEFASILTDMGFEDVTVRENPHD